MLDTPELATALESEQFKKFLDQVPIAIAVSDLTETERVVYANPEFEKLSGLKAASLNGKTGQRLPGPESVSRRTRRWPSALSMKLIS